MFDFVIFFVILDELLVVFFGILTSSGHKASWRSLIALAQGFKEKSHIADADSLFSTDSEEDGEDDGGDIGSVNNDTETGHQTQTIADKRFATEQPVWSDQALGNSVKGSGRDSLLGDSDKENHPQAPGQKNLLIRGQVIEVTDDEDQNDQDDSPSA
ncbi:hypothetical protein JOM56_012680 [Amanita muscaria]